MIRDVPTLTRPRLAPPLALAAIGSAAPAALLFVVGGAQVHLTAGRPSRRSGRRGARPHAGTPAKPGHGRPAARHRQAGRPRHDPEETGALADEEYAVIRRHPEWGHELLGQLGDFSPAVRRLVLDHHERLDGTGYPRGLEEAQLDLETRILAVCDVYDALISPRVYRGAWRHETALRFLHEQAGVALDRRCVAALERTLVRERSVELGIAV